MNNNCEFCDNKNNCQEKKNILSDTVKWHGIHLLICSGTSEESDGWKEGRLENELNKKTNEPTFHNLIFNEAKKRENDNIVPENFWKITSCSEKTRKDVSYLLNIEKEHLFLFNIFLLLFFTSSLFSNNYYFSIYSLLIIPYFNFLIYNKKYYLIKNENNDIMELNNKNPPIDIITFFHNNNKIESYRCRVRKETISNFIDFLIEIYDNKEYYLPKPIDYRNNKSNFCIENLNNDSWNKNFNPLDVSESIIFSKKNNNKKENLILVCTHGARDKRCGRAGPPLIKSLKEEIKKRGFSENDNTNHVIRVRATSHIGGHKFAGTIIIYPQADWYGHLNKKKANIIIDTIIKNKRLDKHWRGNVLNNKKND